MILSAEPIKEVRDFIPRKADAEECLKLGIPPIAAISDSAGQSLESWMVRADGEVVAVWGYGVPNIMSSWCFAWLLTTDAITKHKTLLVRSSIRAIDVLLLKFSGVRVMVDCEYRDSVKWLEWLGFKEVAVWKGFKIMVVTRETFPWVSQQYL